MGPFECHNRYLALRLIILQYSRKPSRISSHHIFYIITLIVAFLCLSTGVIISQPLLHPWPQVTLPHQADNIIVDDKDGSVYIVANGDTFKYSNELKLLTTTFLGQQQVPTANEVTSTKLKTNHNKLVNKILIATNVDNRDVLFLCWQSESFELKCWLHKALELKHASPLFWPKESKGFRTYPNDHMIALVNQNDTNEFLIATSKFAPIEESSTTTTNINQPYLSAISRFKIVYDKSVRHLTLEQRSVLPYQSKLNNNNNLFYEYVYTFNHDQYTYFILNDIQKPITTSLTKDIKIYSRIARICNNDTDLTSYTEISLLCNNNQNDNYAAKVAYLDKTDSNLYIIFEEVDETNLVVRKQNVKASLCSYSMSLVDDYFRESIADCNNGKSTSNLLAKMYATPDNQLPFCQKNPSDSSDWCTSKTNPYIDGTASRYNVRDDTHISLDGLAFINLVFVAKQGTDNKTVLFLGTETGQLIKMSLDEDLYYTIDLNVNHIENYRIEEKFKPKILNNVQNGTSILKTTKYSIGSRSIFASTSNATLNRIDIDACNYYKNCRACLGTKDPLDCVWCQDLCSQKKDCDESKQSTLTCPPVIYDFYPSSGPISGGTKLIIKGDNFGTAEGTLTVKLGESECPILKELSNNELIQCTTKTVKDSTSASLSIEVFDESSYIYYKGSATASDLFKYLKVRIFGLNPSYGSKFSENTINIFGEHLNVGSNRTITLGRTECLVKDYQENQISCIVKPKPTTTSSETTKGFNESIEVERLRVFIDGNEQLLIPQEQSFNGLNLTDTYTFNLEPPPQQSNKINNDNIMSPVDGNSEIDTGSSFFELIFYILLLVSMLTVVTLSLIYREKIKLIKWPPVFLTGKLDKKSDTRVSFKNPQSFKFAQSSNSDPNGVGSSIATGLVKLDGSMMSSDYFGKPEQLLEQDQPLITSSFLDNEMLSILVQEKILIDKNRLTLGHVLGSGQFGRVYKGFLKVEETGEHTSVAVKTLHNRSSWDDAMDHKAFLEEGLMMKDFQHENVLALIGVTFDSNGLPMVITPFMLYGDLKSYISDESSSPTVKELIEFGIQVAKGMAYLSSLKFVHRDLAARNCMLDEDLTVKIADFGLSRDIYESDYYSSDNMKTKLPVKWMAIESLDSRIYNTKTDVWSYGVLLWELMTRGVVPYPDVDNFDLYSYLKEGRRMMRPRYCPLILYKIMLSCWEQNSANRPTFNELVIKVSDVITQLKIAKDGQQKVVRDTSYCEVIT